MLLYSMWEINHWSDGILVSLICIAIVFAVLIVVSLLLGLLNKIKALDVKEQLTLEDGTVVDDDMMAAILTASIDYQKEIKEDVKVVSCKQVED